jgi:nicotinamide mononucleotide transporter
LSIAEIYRQFIADIQIVRWQEWVSTIAQIASVWYAQKNKLLVYPTGIIGVVLAAYVYFMLCNPPLYADAILNIYYLLMSIYGWYSWNKKSNGQTTYIISWCNKKELFIGIGLFSFFMLFVYLMLTHLTNSNTPILDTLVASTAITAMWWMAKRKIENWLAWIVSNAIAIPLNFYKGFMLFTLMYFLFLIMATIGFIKWKEQLNITE